MPNPGPIPAPEAVPSCDTLGPLVLQDPLTGGAFHCLWCNQEWKWTIPAERRSLFILIALVCERLRSEAYLEVRDAHRSVVWRREIRQGETTTHCIRDDEPEAGTLSVGLRGSRDLLLATGLIEEFRGSVYLKVFDERGDPLTESER